MNESIASRIKDRRKELQLTQQQLADSVGKTKGAVSQWEAGATLPKGETLVRLAEKLNCSARWLFYGTPDDLDQVKEKQLDYVIDRDTRPIIVWDAPEDLPDGEFVIVPRVDVRLSAGTGALVFAENVVGLGNTHRIGWVRQHQLDPKKLITAVVTGASMQPTLPEGASVTIDMREQHVVDGKVYAIGYADEVRIKRVYKRYDGALILKSDNPDKGLFPDETIEGAALNHIRIIGRYVAHTYDGEI
ncbi:helix-turn-helix domain-containing protein [Kushneria sp. Sum13]|uniref:helix-turn-helix domain-containing protein n=1 Tax=Kushneria sp. Sum13 TaxID=3459196 RepID=UPI0040455499